MTRIKAIYYYEDNLLKNRDLNHTNTIIKHMARKWWSLSFTSQKVKQTTKKYLLFAVCSA